MNDPVFSGGAEATAARHHLIVRAEVLRPPTDPQLAADWLRRLVNGIGMKLAAIPGNPLVYYCAAPGNRGLTATAIIETSNITLHTWDERSPAELQLDVFTCGALDVDAVLRFVGEFEIKRIACLELDRREDIVVDPVGSVRSFYSQEIFHRE